MRLTKLFAAAALGVSMIGLSACATGLPTRVSRFQAMPAPTGQSFAVVSADPAKTDTLEFSRYAGLVEQAMAQQGYAKANSAADATMLVKLDYGLDEGTREQVVDPFSPYADPFYAMRYGPYAGRYANPYYARRYYGPRSPFYFGWNDPFYSPFDTGVREYTVYKSHLALDIRRKADNQQLFQGEALARSQSDNLGTLVPNLVTAMFTNFPGRSGETIRITVPNAKR